MFIDVFVCECIVVVTMSHCSLLHIRCIVDTRRYY